MGIISTLNDLELTLNNGECLEVIKKERGHIEGHIESMKKDGKTTFNHMKEKVQLLQSYDVLIKVFEDHLGHND